MKSFDSFGIRIARLTRLQASSSSWPVRRHVALTRPLEEIRRSASWLADISIENTATAFLVLIAAYSAMLSAKVVLPMAARAARISRRSEEHTSELQSLMRISYAVFCLRKITYNFGKKY